MIVPDEVREQAQRLLEGALAFAACPSQLDTYDMAERWIRRAQHHADSPIPGDIALMALRVRRRSYILETLERLAAAPLRAPERGMG